MSDTENVYTDSDDDHTPLFNLNDNDSDSDRDSIEDTNLIQPPANNDIPINTPLEQYQTNVNMADKDFSENIEKIYKCLPLIFYQEYEKYKEYEFSKKILAPQSLLYELSGYKNLPFPIYVQIGNTSLIVGVIEYVPFIDCIYIPSNMFYDLGLNENEEIMITILKTPPPNVTKIGIKPLDLKLYEVQDIKVYLEEVFKKMLLTLSLDEFVQLPYLDSHIRFEIKSLEPHNQVSIHDIEQVEIDLLPPDPKISEMLTQNAINISDSDNNILSNKESCQDKKTCIKGLKFFKAETPKKENPNQKSKQTEEQTKFVTFSGTGHTLGSNK